MVYDYIIEEGENPPFNFTFQTDFGIVYFVSIDLYGEKLNHPFEKLYYLNFSKDDEFSKTDIIQKNKKYDARISKTIVSIISDFLESDKSNILFFICDSSDNLHLSRGKLFNNWERINTNDNYEMINLNIENSDIVMACIYNKLGYDTDIIQENIVLQLHAIQNLKN